VIEETPAVGTAAARGQQREALQFGDVGEVAGSGGDADAAGNVSVAQMGVTLKARMGEGPASIVCCEKH
jgi:hypothetical protein